MPADMGFADIRQGTDVEFGMSIYEPFGISQLEPLSFGAICVPTNICGCMGFVRAVTDGASVPNVLEADYTNVGEIVSIDYARSIGATQRGQIEHRENARLAAELLERLPRSDAETRALMDAGWKLAQQMSWEQVVTRFIMPALHETESMLNAK
jgi:hypothetical protein